MNERIATEILAKEIAYLRAQSYAALRDRIGEVGSREEMGADGKLYQLETQVFWDSNAKSGDLRVIVSIDDGGLRAFAPLTDDFIMAPDGSFIGEGLAL